MQLAAHPPGRAGNSPGGLLWATPFAMATPGRVRPRCRVAPPQIPPSGVLCREVHNHGTGLRADQAKPVARAIRRHGFVLSGMGRDGIAGV